MATSITVREIQVLFEMIITKLKTDKLDKLIFDLDEYWIILSHDWGNFSIDPKPAVGSLNEDVKYLKQSLKEGEIYSYSNLDRIASVLRAISEQQAPSK
jgi:hypothetical protein